ncbi:MAG: glycosyltransferase family 4 protein [Streptosporangiaceae bacterium]
MRIAHVTDFYLPRLGGIEMHVRDLAVRQQDAGHDVEIITSSPRPAERRHLEEADGLRVHRLTESAPLAHALHPAGLVAARRLLRRGKYDVVHVHAGPFSPLAFSAITLSGENPTVVTAHSMISYLEPAFRALNATTGWAALPAVWTAVSDVAAEPLRRLVAPSPVHVLPNGIDASGWQIDRLDRVPEEVLVVAVMRLAKRKRPQHLIKMLRRAHERLGPDVRLRAVIVGEGPERRTVERYVRKHGMSGWVSLPGRQSRSQIRELFRRADLFVAPATLESFGIAALEARCAGLPVVARSESGIREFVGEGLEGLLVASDADMIDAIVRLGADHDLREKIADHNRTMPPQVTWPDVMARTDAMYGLATERTPRRELPAVRGLFRTAG